MYARITSSAKARDGNQIMQTKTKLHLGRKRENSLNAARSNRNAINSSNSSRPISEKLYFEERDTDLLKEYGFNPRQMSSAKRNKKKISEMNMRQLDRMKMLLLRNSRLCQGYPENVQKGISRNDPSAFSEALALLSDSFNPR